MSWENNIRNRFEGAEFQPSDEVWLHVRTQIAPPARPKFAWLSATSVALAAAVTLLMVAGAALWLYRPASSRTVAGHHPALSQPLPSPSQASGETARPALQHSGQVAHAARPAGHVSPPSGPVRSFQPEAIPTTPDPLPAPQETPEQTPPANPAVIEVARLQAMASPAIAPVPKMRPLPEIAHVQLSGDATWSLPETGILAMVPDAFREPRKPQWRVHTTVMPYRMNPFAYARKSLDQSPLMLQPNDTVITYRLPSLGVSWQAMAEYQIGCNWSVEIGLQVAHTVASAPLAYNYVIVRPGEPTPTNTANLARDEPESFAGAALQEVQSYTYTEKHIAIRAPILVTLYQHRGRHSLSASVGGARLINLSKIIPMRRMDIEAIARMRYEYALTPSLSVHTGLQFGTPTPRGDFLTPMHVGLQTGLSFRWPS